MCVTMLQSFSAGEASFVEINHFSWLAHVTFDCDIVMHPIDVYMTPDYSVSFFTVYPNGRPSYGCVFRSAHDRKALFQLCGKTVREALFQGENSRS